MKTLIFTLLLAIMSSTAHGQSQCVEIFLDRAEIREAEIIEQLKEVEEIPIGSSRYEDISALGGRNLVEKIELENVAAVVKWSPLSAIYEPLGYQIAKLMKINAPVTIRVKNGKMEGSAQLYIRDTQTLFDLKNGFWFDYSPTIRLFDRLTLNSDRRPQNVLIPLGSTRPRPKDQRPIDHELIFDLSLNSKGREFLEEGPQKFLKDILPTIRKKYPEVHQAMLDPSTRTKILAHMKLVREIGETELAYVDGFFKTYKEINDALDAPRTIPKSSKIETRPSKKNGWFNRLFNWGMTNPAQQQEVRRN